MPLNLPESLVIARQALGLLEQILSLKDEVAQAVAEPAAVLVGRLQAALQRDGAGGRRVTKREARAILAAALDLQRILWQLDLVHVRELGLAVAELARDVARDVAD